MTIKLNIKKRVRGIIRKNKYKRKKNYKNKINNKKVFYMHKIRLSIINNNNL